MIKNQQKWPKNWTILRMKYCIKSKQSKKSEPKSFSVRKIKKNLKNVLSPQLCTPSKRICYLEQKTKFKFLANQTWKWKQEHSLMKINRLDRQWLVQEKCGALEIHQTQVLWKRVWLSKSTSLISICQILRERFDL